MRKCLPYNNYSFTEVVYLYIAKYVIFIFIAAIIATTNIAIYVLLIKCFVHIVLKFSSTNFLS